MKRVPGGGISFTGGEQLIMALGCSHSGLRDISDGVGKWSKGTNPNMDRSFKIGATKILNKLGDWKIPNEEITKFCEWARGQLKF